MKTRIHYTAGVAGILLAAGVLAGGVEPTELIESDEGLGGPAAAVSPDDRAPALTGAALEDVRLMAEALKAKDDELAHARREVERLRGLVVKIRDTNQMERATMHYNLGCAYRAAGDLRRAVSEFEAAAALNPADADVQYNLGILYDDDLKDAKRARLHYGNFLRLRPEGPDAATVRQWLMGLP